MGALLGSSRLVYIYYDSACRTWIYLKNRCDTAISSFVFNSTAVSTYIYAAVLREAIMMAIVQTVHTALDVLALSVQIFVLQVSLDSVFVMWLYETGKPTCLFSQVFNGR
ncbi:hypothetical protein TNCV_4016571 [Trichonephila clavipes]|nr:hypothetical protein TNCV_4016571 [Trichonephila clavipes]